MTVGQILYSRLTTDATVSASIATRCWPDPAPQSNSTYPRIIYLADDAAGTDAMDGPIGLYQQKVTLSCQALDYTTADTLAAAVLKSLDGLRGTVASINVQGIFFENQKDQQYELPNTTTQGLIYASEMDFTIVWNV